jgi:hypothetical protein
MTDAPITPKQAEATQESKDIELARSMKRQPLARKLGESDFHYHRRLSRTLTEAQIQLAHDMHAVHSATASGFVLPPLPVTDEQKKADADQAKSLNVTPIEREPGETDVAFEARLALSPPVGAEGPGPLGAPAPIGAAISAFPNLPRNPGESDADYKVRNDANIARLEREKASSDFMPAPGPGPAPHAFAGA